MKLADEIKVITGSEMNDINCVLAINTLQHKDYCCPFCSHGETIQLKIYREYKGRVRGTYIRAYLECSEGCMSFGIYEATTSFPDSYKDILERGLEVFEKLIKYTKDKIEFILV